MTTQLEQAMRLALEALEFDGFTPEDKTHREYTEKAIIALHRALANSALDRMSENEREIGIQMQPAQDEPVGQLQEEAYGRGQVMWFKKPADKTMLYIRPQPVPTNDTSQEPVDETAEQRHEKPCPYVVSTREGTHHCSLSQREPLTDEMEDQAKRYISPDRRFAFRDGWRSAEQAHGIGEKK